MSELIIETPPVFEPFLQPSRYKAAYGGRGSGKSWFFAELVVEYCLVNHGAHIVCVREVQRTLSQSVKKLIENKIESMGVGHLFTVQDDRIKTPGDGLIIFQGMQNHTADSIKSLEGYNVAWVEEAQSLSQRSLDMLRPTIRKEGSEIWFTWNPDQPDDPVDNLFRGDEPPPNSIVQKVNYMDNPWFPEVLKEEMEYDRNRDKDKFAHVWLGEYMCRSEARIFNNWRVEDFEAPDGCHFRFGADWGYAKDPTVLIRCYAVGKKLYVDYEAYQVGCEIDQTPDLFMTIPESHKWPMRADSARPETIAYMFRHGFPKIIKAQKGKGSIEDGIEFLKSFDIVVHPRCQHTIDELTRYSWKVDDKTDEILPVPADKNNHVIDALRYACEAARLHKARQKQQRLRPPPAELGWLAS